MSGKLYSPFHFELNSTRKSVNSNPVGSITVLLQQDFDDSINNKGFLKDHTRFEACWNRFIKSPGVYPILDKQKTLKLWDKFILSQIEDAKDRIFSVCLENDIIRESMRSTFFEEALDHTKFPKEYAYVQKFGKAILHEFMKSEFTFDLKRGGFFEWVEEMERNVEENVEDLKAKVASMKRKIEAYERKEKDEQYSILNLAHEDSIYIESNDGSVKIQIVQPREILNPTEQEESKLYEIETEWSGRTIDGITVLKRTDYRTVSSNESQCEPMTQDEEEVYLEPKLKPAKHKVKVSYPKEVLKPPTVTSQNYNEMPTWIKDLNPYPPDDKKLHGQRNPPWKWMSGAPDKSDFG